MANPRTTKIIDLPGHGCSVVITDVSNSQPLAEHRNKKGRAECGVRVENRPKPLTTPVTNHDSDQSFRSAKVQTVPWLGRAYSCGTHRPRCLKQTDVNRSFTRIKTQFVPTGDEAICDITSKPPGNTLFTEARIPVETQQTPNFCLMEDARVIDDQCSPDDSSVTYTAEVWVLSV